MEYASYLAGERWSDHPSCTDPVLAALARAVNDLVSDTRRQELLADVPRVIGLRGSASDTLRVAASAAASALPISNMHRQNALAVGLRATLSALDEQRALGDPRAEAPEVRARAEAAFSLAPGATAWVERHPEFDARIPRGRHERAGLEIVRIAACGVAEACVGDADDRLITMLRAAIGELELGRPVTIPAAPQTAAAHAAQPASTFVMR